MEYAPLEHSIYFLPIASLPLEPLAPTINYL